MADKDFISDELLAAYLDGNTNKVETQQVLQTLKTDKSLQEVLQVAIETDKETSPSPYSSSVPRKTHLRKQG